MTTTADGTADSTASALTVEEQATLTAGADMWHTAGIERLGVPSICLTDGPSGARGTQFTGSSSTSMPCGTALASTWNRSLIEQVGRVLGDEARAKGASVLLAPTVNIQRHPLGGRNFECYSEDPYLTAEIAVAFIEGVQSRGVACAVKHFVCNDQETDRMEIDAVVDERTRREIYLPPFEAAVRRAGVWSVMAAYNRIDGRHCSEHAGLLTGLLRDEWGFDGVVMSDWFSTHGLAALTAGLDLEMPGPATFLGHHLVAALEAGEIAAGAIEKAARRVLDLVERTALSRATDAPASAAAAQVARAAATEAIVLLANDGVLPLTGAPRVAVVGWRADEPEFQGGGSAQVVPPYVITPLQGIRDRIGEASVTYESGRTAPPLAPLGGHLLVAHEDAGTGGAVRLDYFTAGDLDGTPLRTDAARETMAVWFGEPAPGVPEGDFSVRLTATLAPAVSGQWVLSVSAAGLARLFLDGERLADTTGAPPGPDFFGLFTVPVETEVTLEVGTTYEIVAEFETLPADGMIPLAGVTVAARPPGQPDAVERAVQAAADADAAIVVVGRDVRETEGQDATTMDLPAEQVDLIRRVASANARTIVAVNTASPVTMDWADDVDAVIQMSYLGQETGTALAAVLFGDADASGRLTTTHPRAIEDSPAHSNFPGEAGTVTYAEGVFVGYRHYDSHGVEPRWCFGHGLSYTTFAYSSLAVAGADGGATVSVDVANTGDRRGSEVVQLFIRPLNAPVARPDRELKGFEKVTLDPGETATVTIALDPRAFAHWDTDNREWTGAPGAYEILVGSSSRDIHQTATWRLDDA